MNQRTKYYTFSTFSRNSSIKTCIINSENKKKARDKLSRLHLKVSRQRKDFAINTACQVITNSDFVGIEDFKVSNMVKNNC